MRIFIHRYHDSIFAGHLGVSQTFCRLLDHVYWPGRREDVRSYVASCSICRVQKSPCPRRAPIAMGHVFVGHRWDRVTMDILDMSVTTEKGNRYVLVIVDCFSRWAEACPLPNKMAVAVADAFFQLIISVASASRRSSIQIRAASLTIILCRSCASCWWLTNPYDSISSG